MGEKYSPDIIVKDGFGVFSTSKEKIEIDFQLVIYPTAIRIYCHYNLGLFPNSDLWTLKGIAKEGETIYGASLLAVHVSNSEMVFAPMEDILFGSQELKNVVFAKFPLIGYYDGRFEIEIDECKYKIAGDVKEAAKNEKLSKIWDIQFEGLALEISCANLQKEDYLKKASEIANLLSLATGNEIGFYQQMYFDENQSSLTVWRAQHLDDFGVYPCIPSFEMNNFLNLCLRNYTSMSESEKKTLFVAVNYINSTRDGYIEERILKIAQAWELVSTEFLGESYELPIEVENLRKRLKKFMKEWRNEDEKNDSTGFLTSRLLGSLEWDKAIAKSAKLASVFKVDLGKIKLDLFRLFADRNSVAHTGRFRNYENDRLAILDAAVFGLQLILLRKLKYEGLVQAGENGWTTFKQIEELIAET